jgi:hypothetical protein
MFHFSKVLAHYFVETPIRFGVDDFETIAVTESLMTRINPVHEANSAAASLVEDYTKTNFSICYRSPAAYADHLTATGHRAAIGVAEANLLTLWRPGVGSRMQ